jgi:hypothetical protein
MAQMQALLKIKADVEGEGKINALGRAIGGLSGTAGKVSGGLRGMADAAGGLGGALRALVPLATGAGLITLAKNSMDNAAKMFDLSQKTGVSVEALSRFSKAAKVSGTDVEGVTKALVKLSKGLIEAKNGQGQAGEALKSMGISATDASGKLKDTDQIMLEISNKFKAMPNGAEKTALALQLFGRSGADLIPMLNMGGEAIGKFGAMTTKYAEDANKGADAMVTLQGKVGMLGGKLAVVLLPSITAITESLVKLLDGFNALPGPIQGLIIGIGGLTIALVLLAPAIGAVAKAFGLLSGLKIGATIAGWAPAIIPLKAALAGFLTWVGSTFIPGLLAFFSGPAGWTVLAVAAVVAMVVLFRKPIGDFFNWLGDAISKAFSGLMKLLYPIFVQPFIDIWNNVLRAPVTTLFGWIVGYIKFSMQTAYALAYQVFVQPWVNLWNVVLRQPVTAAITWIQGAWTAMVEFLPKAMNTIGDKVKSIFTGVVNTVKGAMRNVLQFIANAVNSVGKQVNKLIAAFNKLPGPNIPYVPILKVPQFAQGGVVNGPTLAMVGEGGESEYIIPASKMAAASANYLNGARGGAVIPAFANGGYVGGGNAQINVTTGPVLQQGGQQYVTMADLERAMRKTADGVYSSLRTPAGRYAAGVR